MDKVREMSNIEQANKILGKLIEISNEAAVLIHQNKATMIKIAEKQPSITQSWNRFDISIYLNKDGRIFVTSLETPDIDNALKEITNIKDKLNVIEESEYNYPLPEPTSEERRKEKIDKKIVESIENPSKILDTIYSTISEYSVKTFSGMIRAGLTTRTLVTSKGFEGEETSTFMNGYIRVFGEKTSGQWSVTSSTLDLKGISDMVKKAADYATMKLPEIKIENKKQNLILSPMVAGNLFEMIADLSTAMAADLGFSFLIKYKIGEKIASEKITFKDIPRDTELPGSTLFDDEGIKTYNKPIIENGIFKTFLHNTKTANKYKTKTTGNAGWISPHPWLLEILPGNMDEDEMIREIRSGVLITNNWYTRLQNYLEGQFSSVARDAIIYIENGEPKGLIKKLRIADTFPNILRNIVELGKKTYNIEWWEVEIPIRLPFILLENINVTLGEQ